MEHHPEEARIMQAGPEDFRKRYESLVRRESARYARSAEEAEDIAQDTWLRIYSRYEVVGNTVREMPAWIRVVVKNAAMDQLRRNRLHPPIEEYGAAATGGAHCDPEREVMARCELQEILRELKTARWPERRIVRGIIAGENGEEIAAELGKTRDAVYLCLCRLRKRLRRWTEP